MITIANKRIPRHSSAIRRFVGWLNEYYKIKKSVALDVLPTKNLNHLRSDIKKNDTLYAFFLPNESVIFLSVGSCRDDTTAFLLLAHEYRHARQDLLKQKFTERGANAWAANVVLQYNLTER